MRYLVLISFLIVTFSYCLENNIDPLSEAEKRYPSLTRYQPEGIQEEILFGTLQVYENREEEGKKISLNVYLFPSYNTISKPKVFIDYNGGPASPNESLISYYEKGGV